MPGERRLSPEYREQVDTRCDREVAKRAGEEWGVLSTERAARVRVDAQRDLVVDAARAQLHRLHRGVWAVGHPSPPYEGRMLAAVKACGPAAVLSHWSAAELWGFVEEQARRPQVTVVGTSTRVVPGLVVHRTSCLDPRDRTRHRGVPTTGAARTLARPRGHRGYRDRPPGRADGAGEGARPRASADRGRRTARPAARQSQARQPDRSRVRRRSAACSRTSCSSSCSTLASRTRMSTSRW